MAAAENKRAAPTDFSIFCRRAIMVGESPST